MPLTVQVTIRPVRPEDAGPVWEISREPGVIENILRLPSDRVDQWQKRFGQPVPNDHFFVAKADGEVVGFAGLVVGEGRLRHGGASSTSWRAGGTAAGSARASSGPCWTLMARYRPD
ncbi:MAG TPA: hypothetical protein VIK99_09525 [Thermaerobacter sp.]